MAFRNRSVDVHKFSMIPRADIPRSSFRMEKMLKTAFNAGYLVPILCEEVLPGDTFNVRATMFGRLATPIVPFLDNLHMDTFFFFVPNRLVWDNWQKFMGEQANPGDSISYVVPKVGMPSGGYVVGSIYDYFGLPTVGQVAAGEQRSVNALALRGYNLIWNEWFRDENLQNSVTVSLGDGPDSSGTYALLKRGKRKDYFTGALPWPQKGASVPLPLTGTAPVVGLGKRTQTFIAGGATRYESNGASTTYPFEQVINVAGVDQEYYVKGSAASSGYPQVFADLSQATATTINALRQSFQIQKLLERDARGGTRYTELVRSHFGVVSPDARLQRPEYLGGGSQRVSINPIAQNSPTVDEGTTPQGNLAAIGSVLAQNHGFTQSFTEHGYVLGLVMLRADLTYQQGLRRHWQRATRYDYYFPAFAMLGEQAILRKEIYCDGNDISDETVFGYQERWAEYRYAPSEITGVMRSTSAGTLDAWHLAQRFTSAPLLNATFIAEDPPVDRVIAVVPGITHAEHMLLDVFYEMKVARPLPMYSVPGLIDHF